MREITQARRNKIIEETQLFLKYDHLYTKKQWQQYTEYLAQPGQIENLLEAFYSFDILKLVVFYIYSHTNDEGEVCRLDDCLKNDEYVNKYQVIFKRARRDFLHILFFNQLPLFFIDVDNTLTDFGELSQEKIDYIKNYKYKDRIVLSTGKVSDSIMNVIKACGLEHNYYCCLNGSVICKDGEFELINKVGKVSEEIIPRLKKTGLVFIGYYENAIKKIVELDEFSISMLKKYNEWFVNEDDELDCNRIVKLLCYIKDDGTETQKQQEKMVQDIVKDYPELCCVRTAYHCYEILRRDQHKGNGVKAVCEKNDIYYRCTVGVGDSMNDYPMLTYTGKSYIVSTSSDELKSHNFEILPGSRSEDIVLLLKKFENREME